MLYFNSVVLGAANVFPLLEETHALPHLFMQRKTGIPEIDNAPHQLLMWPRKTGKSTCGTVGKSLWLACKDPNTAILIANEKQETAADFIASIKHHIEHTELLRALFPEIIPPDFNAVTWSATRATVNRTTGRPEPTFDCIGVGGTVTGKHYDHIICDDLISREAAENARAGSWIIMDRANRWVNQLTPLLSQYQPFPTLTFIGTRWFNGDTYEHIEKAFGYEQETTHFRIKLRLTDGQTVSRNIYRVGDLAVLKMAAREDGKLVFPKIWSDEELEKEQIKDPEFYASNLLNNPTDATVRTFQDPWLKYWTSPSPTIANYRTQTNALKSIFTSELYKLVVVDPAFSSMGAGTDSRAAIVVIGVDTATGAVLVLEATAEKRDPKDLATDIVHACKRHKANRLFVECVAQQISFIRYVEAEVAKTGLGLAVEQCRPAGRNKDVRIETLVPHFKAGNLYVHAGQHQLLQEFRDFKPGARHKDLLDALAYAMEVRPQYGTSDGMTLKERNAKQLQLYRERRGISGRAA